METKMETKKVSKKKLTTEERLAAEEKVPVFLPAAKYGPVWEGSINGYPIILYTEQTLMVPASVAALIKDNDDLRKKSEYELKKYGGKGFNMRNFEE